MPSIFSSPFGRSSYPALDAETGCSTIFAATSLLANRLTSTSKFFDRHLYLFDVETQHPKIGYPQQALQKLQFIRVSVLRSSGFDTPSHHAIDDFLLSSLAHVYLMLLM